MKNLNVTFIGSFYKLDQLPKDSLPQIAFAGRSNVGKSSLLNKITGHKKAAKVSQTPGKTRALNFFLINEKFYFVDLPGYGYAKVSKAERESWGQLIEDYLVSAQNLAGLMLLLDCRRDPNPEDEELIRWLGDRELPCMAIITKTDKITRDKTNRKQRQIQNAYGLATIPFSTIDGTGKEDVLKAIYALVTEKN